MDLETRKLTRMETDDDQQWKNVVEWCKRNPLKDASVFAESAEERDRIRSRIAHFNGERMPLNCTVEVKPSDFKTPVHVRI